MVKSAICPTFRVRESVNEPLSPGASTPSGVLSKTKVNGTYRGVGGEGWGAVTVTEPEKEPAPSRVEPSRKRRLILNE